MAARSASTAASAAHQRFEDYVVPEIPYLYDQARRLTGSPSDAEDLVQDTLMRALGAIERFDGAHPRAWLMTILRNVNINRARRRTPSADDTDPDTLVALGREPADLADARELAEAVAEVVDGLPEAFRSVLVAVDGEGLSYADAAVALHLPIGTVMSRLHRARRRLRAGLAERGLAPATQEAS